MTLAGSTSVIIPGSEVYTVDGEFIGMVKDVSGMHFKVDPINESDYWLMGDFVAKVAPSRIALVLRSHQLGDYKIETPRRQS